MEMAGVMGGSSVIPGRRATASPESIFANGGYGFRACRFAAIGMTIDLHPGPRCFGLLLEVVDLLALDHGQADIVEAFEQALLAVRLNIELHYAAVRAANLLLFQVDGERCIGAALGIIEQLFQILGR